MRNSEPMRANREQQLQKDFSKAMERLDYTAAMETAKDLIRQLPESARPRYMLARVLMHQGDFAEAERHLIAAARLFEEPDGHLSEDIYFASIFCKAARNPDSFAKQFHATRLPSTKSPDALVLQAALKREFGEHSEALTLLKRAETAGAPDALFHAANIHHVLGDTAKAERLAKKALAANPDDINSRALLAAILSEKGMLPESAAQYRKAIAISPKADNADLMTYMLADCLYKLGKKSEAAKTYRSIARSFPKSLLRISSGRIASSLEKSAGKDLPKAELEFPRLMQARGQCAPTAMSALLLFWKIRLSPKAISSGIYTDGVRSEKIGAFLRKFDLGVMETAGTEEKIKSCIRSGMPVMADEYYGLEGHAIVVFGFDDNKGTFRVFDPNFMEPVDVTYGEFTTNWRQNGNWMLVAAPSSKMEDISARMRDDASSVAFALAQEARALQERGFKDRRRLAESTAVAMKAAEARPAFPTPYRIIMENLLISGLTKEAIRHADAIKGRFGRHFWLWRYLGDAQLAAGEHRKAIESYGNAVRLYPSDAHVYTNLAFAHSKLKDFKKAMYYTKKSEGIR